MRTRRFSVSVSLSFLLAACAAEPIDPTLPASLDEASFGTSSPSERAGLTPIASANAKTPGVASPNVLPPELVETIAAQGSNALENPTAVPLGNGASLELSHYGYNANGPMLPAPGDMQSATHNVEAQKTEPDKNTYLVLRHQTGADPSYDYGSHFLFQGHENGARNAAGAPVGYITRINLDADDLHHVTMFAALDRAGDPLPVFDGSTWDPFAQRLLFTSEGGANGGVWQSTLDFPPVVDDISGALGRGGYEGIQNDSDGNVWIVEDVGGPSGTVNSHARQPNSFIYRFVPTHVGNLREGKLQALQVISLGTGTPIAFHAGQADADILSADVRDLHTYGNTFPTRWVTLHDTESDGAVPFNANALAKAKLATPFKRPENGSFRPGSEFQQFFFDETGDTSALTEAGSDHGGFGGVFVLTQSHPSANSGTLRLFYRGDVDHTGFDNCAFWSEHQIVFVEDRGDTLHTQHNALDSAFLFDTRADYANPRNQPLRILAEGRDPSATIDSALSGLPGFNNDGDNEITGFHVSNGDAGRRGILGARIPRPFQGGWRVFYTEQHGDNVTWEVLSRRDGDDD